jgi:hypothetical protein
VTKCMYENFYLDSTNKNLVIILMEVQKISKIKHLMLNTAGEHNVFVF